MFVVSCISETIQDITKRTDGRDMSKLEEQRRPKNSNKVVRPFSHGPSSAFRPWQPSLNNDIGKQEASSSGVNVTPQDNNNLNIEKSNLGYIEKNPMNGGRATAGELLFFSIINFWVNLSLLI